MCSCDYELPEFYEQETLRARKPHKCVECGRIIQAGETYEYVRGKWDGDFLQFHTCTHCLAVREAWMRFMGSSCWLFSGLYEEIANSDWKYYPGRFSVGRRMVEARRAKQRTES